LRAYIATRLATAVLVILGVSLVSFLLTFLTGDPAEIMLPAGGDREPDHGVPGGVGDSTIRSRFSTGAS
jgi:ABC-type dipeptide/oligopeptide/nickel transport system permease component